MHIDLGRTIRIPLTPPTRTTLEALTRTHDFGKVIVSQYVAQGDEWLLSSNDCLVNCWVSKRITEAVMTQAAREVGFTYEDTSQSS